MFIQGIEENIKQIESLLNKIDKLLNEKEIELENALKNEKTVHTCLHCGNDTPLYCEKCHQELITKNGELQLKNEELITYCKKCIIIDRLNEYVENSIPKQAIRDKIQEITDEFKERIQDNDSFYFDYSNEYAHIEEVLEELLYEEY